MHRCTVIIVALALALATTAGAVTFEEQWNWCYDTPGRDDLHLIALDGARNIYAAGKPGLFKLDPDGNELWHASFGNWALAVDAAGNAYVDEYDPALPEPRLYELAKYDTSGNRLWKWGDGSFTMTYNIVDDGAGGLWAMVRADNRATVVRLDAAGQLLWRTDSSFGVYHSPQGFAVDAEGAAIFGYVYYDDHVPIHIIEKLDSSGNVLWTQSFTHLLGSAITVDAAGNIFLGTTAGLYKLDAQGNQLVFQPLPSKHVSGLELDPFGDLVASFSNGWNPSTVTKFNSDLVPLWTQSFEPEQTATDLAVNADGDIYVSGSRWALGWTKPPKIVSYKFSTDGKRLFYEQYPGVYYGYGAEIAVDDKGSYYVVAYTWYHCSLEYGGIVIKYSKRSPVSALTALIESVAGLPASALDNPNNATAFNNKLAVVLAFLTDAETETDPAVQQRLYSQAINKLTNDILRKVDGCANDGAPDNNDWIGSCAYQADLYTDITDLIADLQALCPAC